jgi:hypothetical protein
MSKRKGKPRRAAPPQDFQDRRFDLKNTTDNYLRRPGEMTPEQYQKLTPEELRACREYMLELDNRTREEIQKYALENGVDVKNVRIVDRVPDPLNPQKVYLALTHVVPAREDDEGEPEALEASPDA